MVTNKFKKEWIKMQVSAHESAVIDEPVQIGEDTKIWHFVHISEKAKIGKRCMLGQGCFIDEGATIGDDVRLQNGVSVYKDVIIEDGVYIGPGVTFMNKRRPGTGSNDDFQVTLIKYNASIGPNATILCGVTIGENSMVGAGAVVNKNVPPDAMVVGNPGRILKYLNEE